MAELSNAETTLLGLLAEEPMHPYQIEKEVEWRDMRFWTELSMSSIYKLLRKLEKEQRVTCERAVTEGNRVRKVYSLTPEGRAALAEKLRLLLSEPEHVRWRVDIGVSNLAVLPLEEAAGCLERYREELGKQASGYRDLEKFLIDNDCPLHRLAVARRPMYLLEAEIRWVDDFLAEIREAACMSEIHVENARVHNLKGVTSPSRATGWWCSPGSRARASRRWSSTPCTPRPSGSSSRPSAPSPAAACPSSPAPRWTPSTTSPPRSSLTSSAWAAPCAPRWARPRRSIPTCGCSSRAAATRLGSLLHFGFNHPEGMCPACKGLGKRIQVDTERMLDPTQPSARAPSPTPTTGSAGGTGGSWSASTCSTSDKPLREFTAEELERLLHAEGMPIDRSTAPSGLRQDVGGIARRLERLYVNKAEDELPRAGRDAYQRYLVYGRLRRLRRPAAQPARAAVGWPARASGKLSDWS